MPECCVCYTTDQRLLLPTVLSARQARLQVSREAADVMVFAFDLDREAFAVFGRVCESEGIGFRSVDRRLIEGMSGMYSRLFLDRFVPDTYSQFLYLDGDVQILRSIEPLCVAEVPADGFLAVRDPMTFMLDGAGRRAAALRTYLQGLGLGSVEDGGYFNSGMLRMSRTAWRGIGREAHTYLQHHPESCRFHDQSALNAVSAGRHRLISLKWNFPIFLRNCWLDRDIEPAVVHFMSRPKPWDGSFPPWDRGAFQPYIDLVRSHPSLAAYYPAVPQPIRRVRYQLQQHAKRALEAVAWGHSRRRSHILQYETLVGGHLPSADQSVVVPHHLVQEPRSLAS